MCSEKKTAAEAKKKQLCHAEVKTNVVCKEFTVAVGLCLSYAIIAFCLDETRNIKTFQ